MANKLREFWNILIDAGYEFIDDNATKLSASLAYYTLFSIGPLLLVIITVIGALYNRASVTSHLFDQMSGFIGPKVAAELQSLLEAMRKQTNTTLLGIIGILVFLFGATGIFSEIQSSLNYIWSVKPKPKRGWVKYITDRLLSLALVIGMAFLMMVTLFVNVIIDVFSDRLKHFLGDTDIVMVKGANIALLFVVAALIFTIIYKILPAARISWKDAIIGACFTSVLFLIGKLAIGYYLNLSRSINLYGAATSIILLLTWVYYSAMIIYYGAEFTEVFAKKWGDGMAVKKNAVHIIKHEHAGKIARDTSENKN